MPSSDRASLLYVKYMPDVWLPLGIPTMLRSWYTVTSRSGSPYGSGRSSTPLTRAKIATAAPMPMIRVIDAVSVNAGLRRSDLQAGFTTDDRDMSSLVRLVHRPTGLGRPRFPVYRFGTVTRASAVCPPAMAADM